jgi:hypothetical protein
MSKPRRRLEPKKQTSQVLYKLDGQTYYSVIRAMRTNCLATSLVRLPQAGKKLPRCYEYLGRMLALLDQVASCAWGCPGTEDGHVLHRMIGRGVSSATSAIELALIGQYDDSLAATRSIGELANLLWLFSNDSSAFADWKSLESRARWSKYRPAKVRRKLLAIDELVLVEEEEYSALSEHGVHVTPSTSPNTIGAGHQPTLGGIYREDSLVICINEVSWAIGVLALPSVKLLGPAKDSTKVLQTSKSLLMNVGGFRVSAIADFLERQSTAQVAS